MSRVLVLLMTINVVVVIWVGGGGCPCPPFISKGAGVTRKVPSRLQL
jgi:hypothetical protein